MNSSFVESLIQGGESDRVEFKTPDAELEHIAAAVCAFLNTAGGTVVVGVDETGKVVSVADAEMRAKAIETFLQRQISPSALCSVNTDPMPQGSLITIEVPVGRDRPYVCAGSIFVRKGAQSVPADAETIRRLVHEQYVQPTRWERLPASGLELEELDEAEIQGTVEESQRKRGFFFHDSAVPAVLADLGLSQAGQLTSGADVLFAKNPSRRLPQTRVRATLYSTNKGGDFADDRLFEGNAFSLLEQLFAFVRQHVQIAAEFRPGKVEREDRPQYPFDALREGLINAIVHRDYSVFSGGMSVGVYPNRIEIWNTGRLPEGLRVIDLKRNHPSLPANPDMAHVFYLRGIIERVGRGTLKIVEQCQSAGLPTPVWDASPTGITLVFRSKRTVKRKLNPRQAALLQKLQPGQTLKPADYYEEMGSTVSQRQAQRDLTSLESGGWLRREGDGPATVYVRTDQPRQ